MLSPTTLITFITMSDLEHKLLYGVPTGYVSSSDEETDVKNQHNTNITNDDNLISSKRTNKCDYVGCKAVINDFINSRGSDFKLSDFDYTTPVIHRIAGTEFDQFIKEKYSGVDDINKQIYKNPNRINKLIELNLDNFKEEVEVYDAKNSIPITILHIYENNNQKCSLINKLLHELVNQLIGVKLCCIKSSIAGYDINFQLNALPVLQCYKKGQLFKSYIRIEEKLELESMTVNDLINFFLDERWISEQNAIFQ